MQYYWTQLLKMKERGGDSFRLFGVQLDHHDVSSSPSSFSLISSDTKNRQRWSMDYLSSSTALRLTSCLPGYEANIGINGYRYQGGLQETNYTQGE
jgi:predicted patatin/cPLA2 family phospholipase